MYHNDRFLSGTGSLDREKRFFNIVSFRKNVATRATDLDTKDVQVQNDPITKTSYAAIFLLNLKSRTAFLLRRLRRRRNCIALALSRRAHHHCSALDNADRPLGWTE
ncbi:hypothetical protein NLM27_38890 [Bradyrhizobium sp. CCGB12]|uniref:hypothetical protein n=1 Tax=Bradyrhizobium sp. CCGB12 TaxID=2949632 RepID=UPI0020B2A136|nr:hypothetical protein [Bradyrhizobium sp. CCGB12]MCP3394724.1 hypothetical protein [Bradyrhizobium sp. CCGB12]